MTAINDQALLRLHADDNIAIAKRPIAENAECRLDGHSVVTQEAVNLGHKVALSDLPKGEPVRKFGQLIGFTTESVSAGQWIHSHNLEPGELELDYAFSSEVPDALPTPEPRTFQGYRRADGRAATRNYIGLISTVNCSATTAKYVAQNFDESLLADYPNIDGVVPLVHKIGCAMQYGGEDHEQLARTLAGFAKHPNIGAYLVLGLGCETGHPSFLVENHNLVQLQVDGQTQDPLPLVLTIQEQGGVKKTVERATRVLEEMLPEVNQVAREPIPVSELVLGTQCGGSDGYSGVTANPAVGIASDLLVAHGATSILAETTEIHGGEHLLTRRAVNREVGQKLVDRIRWWEEYAAKFGAVIDNNPSVGNKLGGLTTIYEKSLGAIAKAGSTALKAVYQYAEPVNERGLVVMDTPGFDPASMTGMVAGGANILVFTTGRGSCYGCKPVPCLKVASNTPMFERMSDDMDVNAGRVIEGASVEEVGREIFERLVSMASGEPTKSEEQGIGDEEFAPWNLGPIL